MPTPHSTIPWTLRSRLSLLAGALVGLGGCYSENPTQTTLDLTELVTKVALVGVNGEGGDTVDFGVVAKDVTTLKLVLLANVGAYSASNLQVTTPASGSLEEPFAFAGGSFPGDDGTCTDQIEAQAGCLIALSITPTEHGTLTSELELSYNNGLIKAPLPLTLKAVTVGEPEFSPASPHDFGNVAVGATADLSLTVTNIGGSALTGFSEDPLLAIAGDFRFKGGTFPGTGGDCEPDPDIATLELQEDCTLVIEFAPSAPGAVDTTLTLLYNNGLADVSAEFELQGTGL